LALDPALETLITEAVAQSVATGTINIEPSMAEKLGNSLKNLINENADIGDDPVVLTNGNIRSLLSGFFKHMFPDIHVLSYGEIPASMKINFIGNIG